MPPEPEVDEENDITSDWIAETRVIRQWVNGGGVSTNLLYDELKRWADYWKDEAEV